MLTRYSLLLLSLISLNALGQDLPTDHRVKLPSPINTNGDEGGSIISRDGSMLVFIRAVRTEGKKREAEDQQDVFISHRKADGTWSAPESPGTPVNSPAEDNTCAGIGQDNNSLYLINLVRTKRSLNRGVSKVTYNGTAWENPQPLAIPGRIPPLGFFSAYVAPDESYVLISAPLEGREDEDIYVCTKNADGTFTAPQSLGDQINTKTGYEATPFMSPDGKVLFFASNGHGGQGDADIFMARRGDTWTSWEAPVNLGPKINTPGFDGSFSVDNNWNAYFASGEGANAGPGDLYGINVRDMLTPKPAVDSTKSVVDNAQPVMDSAAPQIAETPGNKPDLNGNANNLANGGKEGDMSAGTKGTKGTKGSKGSNDTSVNSSEPSGDGGESSASVDASNLPKAYFETNSATLTDEYRDEINSAVAGALKGRKAYITIYGFADNVGSNGYNMNLSRRRAQAVKNALVKSGIKSSRIKVKGFGEGNPAADNSTEEGRKENRRVEIHMSK